MCLANPRNSHAAAACLKLGDRGLTEVDAAGNEVTFDPQAPGTPTPVTIEADVLGFVACPSATQCTAIDNQGNYAQRGAQEITFNPQSPTSPSRARFFSGQQVFGGFACPSTMLGVVTISNGSLAIFNPQSPGTVSPVAVASGTFLGQIACPSTTQCTAVAQSGGGELTFNPQSPGSPTLTTIDSGQRLDNLACPSITECVTVDERGHSIKFNPQSPSPVVDASLSYSSTFAIDCSSTTQCTALAQSGVGADVQPTGARDTHRDSGQLRPNGALDRLPVHQPVHDRRLHRHGLGLSR